MYSPSNYSPSTPDPTTKRGIIILSIFLLLLIVFFTWYNYRSSRLSALSSSGNGKENFLTTLFNPTTSPENVPVGDDSDNDGLNEAEENKAGTDILKSDTDNDGLTDREEVKVYKTNPLQADSDNDTMNDGDEIQNRRDPNNSSANAPWPPTPPAFSPNK